jgi:hypothetical protein
MEMQKKGRLHTMESEDREKASLTLADDVIPSDIHDDNETGRRAGEQRASWREGLEHTYIPAKSRLPSDAHHSHRIEAITTAPPAHQSDRKSPAAPSRYER